LHTNDKARIERIVALFLAVFLSTVPAFAASKDEGGDGRGLFVELETWSAAPAGAGTTYAFVVPEGTPQGNLSGGGRVVTLGFEHQQDLGIRFGSRIGANGGSRFIVSFQELERSARSETGTQPGRIGALLASPDFAIGRTLVDFAGASSQAKTTLASAVLEWELLEKDNRLLTVAAGLRYLAFEQGEVVTYRFEGFGGLEEQVRTTEVRSSGLGPMSEVRFGYRYGKRVTFGARIGIAAIIGNQESVTSDLRIGDRFTLVIRPDVEVVLLQVDGELRLDVLVSHGASLYAAFRYIDLGEVRTDLRFVDDVGQNTALPASHSVAYEGFVLGLAYRF